MTGPSNIVDESK